MYKIKIKCFMHLGPQLYWGCLNSVAQGSDCKRNSCGSIPTKGNYIFNILISLIWRRSKTRRSDTQHNENGERKYLNKWLLKLGSHFPSAYLMYGIKREAIYGLSKSAIDFYGTSYLCIIFLLLIVFFL